jgi:hypothetical protein
MGVTSCFAGLTTWPGEVPGQTSRFVPTGSSPGSGMSSFSRHGHVTRASSLRASGSIQATSSAAGLLSLAGAVVATGLVVASLVTAGVLLAYQVQGVNPAAGGI